MKEQDGISDMIWIISGVVLGSFILVLWVAMIASLI